MNGLLISQTLLRVWTSSITRSLQKREREPRGGDSFKAQLSAKASSLIPCFTARAPNSS